MEWQLVKDYSLYFFGNDFKFMIFFNCKGLVTTTKVTHASPAGVYAHTANRNWENNQILLDMGGNPEFCTDIAKQLINGDVGKKLKVCEQKSFRDAHTQYLKIKRLHN